MKQQTCHIKEQQTCHIKEQQTCHIIKEQQTCHIKEQQWKVDLTGDFCKDLQWSPDGSYLLGCTEQQWIQIYDAEVGRVVHQMHLPETIHDACWYPWMRAVDVGTVCLITATHQSPIQLWGGVSDDATLGLRASYVPMEEAERFAQTIATTFTASGANIISGSRESLYIFDTTRPGKYPLTHLKLSPTRGSREGQKGHVCCLAVRRDDTPIVAAGSFTGSLGIYDWRTPGTVMVLPCARGDALTQLAFHPDGWHLISAARKDPLISCMDLRFMGDGDGGNVGGCCASWDRGDSKTNQRLHFSLYNDHLVFGNRSGSIGVVKNPCVAAESTTVEFHQMPTKQSIPAVSLHGSQLAIGMGDRSEKEEEEDLIICGGGAGALLIYSFDCK